MSEAKSLNHLFTTVGKNAARPDAIDKVQGKALFGADIYRPNMLHACLLGSPHAHARIVSIDASAALALPGVKAVVTGDDFPDMGSNGIGAWIQDNMAQGKALYHGHTIAAVAATSRQAAEDALAAVEVEYEVLPLIANIDQALANDAVVLHDDPNASESSNVCARENIAEGDIAQGFAEADVIVEREFSAPTAHQGYIEPPACVAEYSEASPSTIWTTTQGHFVVRANVARTLSIELAQLKVIPTEIGGGFGGKGGPYMEAIALTLSRKAGRPVKMVMSREEIFRIGGPGAAFQGRYKIGAKQDGTLTAFEADFAFDSGAFPGAPLHGGMDTIFRCYRIPNVKVDGASVLTNKPMVRAYRGPGGPQVTLGTETLMNELARQLRIDPIELRLRNAVVEGDPGSAGPFRAIGFVECLEAAKASEHYNSQVADGAGRAIAAGYWHNGGDVSSAEVHMNADGTVNVSTGSVDLSGTRITLAMLASERLGIPIDKVSANVADTESVGYSFVSGGSRTVNVTGQAVLMAADDAMQQMAERAASGWNITPERVEWRDGEATNPDSGESLSMRDICRKAPYTGGTITGKGSLNVKPDLAPSFAVHVCDINVDRDTGQSRITRYSVIQDAGCAVHPDLVEGQFQGGAVQGIGWALNEEYVYDAQGRLENPAFLDYRMPLASDLPMIETVIVEVPNPLHPYGVRGVGEAGVIPPLAAVACAISDAIDAPVSDLPCSPARVLACLEGVYYSKETSQ
jgi:CO/xanthine dehydrogenase Mo-binding subunit